MKFKCHKCR